ncbi:MAG TPA: GNAT family N-acetyltransferase [Gaiellaceae bacterium]|nr:GNAT family N-acetyltransferase [Gaiellaceae bacterium]
MSRAEVTLREITGESVRAICALEVAPEQRGFVAPNAISIAQAHFEPKAWFRAVYADDDPVGFVMLFEDAEKSEYFLWRLMVDAGHQGKGYGRRTLDLVVERVRGLPGAAELLTSYVPGDAGPRDFYLRYGFVETGEVEGAERVIRLELRP